MKVINLLIEKILFNNEIKYDGNEIPENIFGVFVSIERSKYQKLNKYPEDVHGCIGYWDNNYKNLDNETIIKKILDVGHSATYSDSRKDYFPKNLLSDIFAKFKIYYMLSDIIKFKDNDNGIMENGILFNNKKYGIIVENNQNKATYLPNVFPNKDWEYIKNSVIKKADINNNENIKFIAYNTIIDETTIIEHLMSQIKTNINNLFNKKFIVYEIIDYKKIINKNQDIRNIATIYDLLQLDNNYDFKIMNYMKNVINYYINIIKKLSNQAISFLILVIKKLNMTINVDDFINKLYNSLDILEKKFELGEVLMALSIVNPRKKILNEQIDIIINIIKNNDKHIDNIFQYNWFSKFILNYNNEYVKESKIINILTQNVLEIMKLFDFQEETNYLVVALECLTSLYLKSLKLNLSPNYFDIIENLFESILRRRNKKLPLYEFKNGDIRLDITGHMINSFVNLINIDKLNKNNMRNGENDNYKKYIKNKKIYKHFLS